MSFSFRGRIVAFAMLASAGLYGQTALATNILVVGPNTCQPGKPHYTSIQTAVNAVPSGGSVLVCPGTYLEQVAISKPLTLKGVTDGTNNAAIIAVPGGGLIANASAPTQFGPVSGQIAVRNTSGVTVSNLTIDGTGSGCVPGAVRAAGIAAYNVGNTLITGVTVRNEVTGCLIGEGILADSSSITITSSQFHDIDRTGIVVNSGVGTVEFNNVQNATFYGVGLYLANKTVVSSNTVAGLNLNPGANDAAIMVQNSNNTIVSKNTLLASPSFFVFGVWLLNSSGSSATGNIVSDFAYGIVMQGAGASVVQTNKLSQLLGDGIFDGGSLGGNNVTKNTVNEAAFGIFTDGTTGGDVLVPNTFYNTTTTIDPNPSQVGNPVDM